MTELHNAPATLRNRDAIAPILSDLFASAGAILEIASGTGQHAAHFAKTLPDARWQPTDLDDSMFESIVGWAAQEQAQNVLSPLKLDVTEEEWPVAEADGAFCANMIHIAPWAAAVGLMTGLARVLKPGAPFALYGPFREGGRHTAPSNVNFDKSLRTRNPTWGVRDLEQVTALAAMHGLEHTAVHKMPANNLILIFNRQSQK